MRVDYALPDIAEKIHPCVLTIGNFDGVHLGHQFILKHLTQSANRTKQPSVVLTFSNHPSTILRPQAPRQLLCTNEHKLLLLESAHVDHTLMIPFEAEVADQTAEIFLRNLQRVLPFSKLILGNDAHIGKDRKGDRNYIKELAKLLNFQVEYIEDYVINGKRISSSLIREFLQKGNFQETNRLLGRTYSIYAPVQKGSGRGSSIGFPTANINVEGLCLPPLGVYAVYARYNGDNYPGVANLGVAPTMKQTSTPLLEVHIFDQNIDLYEQFVEIKFEAYLRPEKRFDSIDDLKLQIARDVLTTRDLFKAID